ENRVQDALRKIELLPEDVVWHMVGHLQSNKVNKVLGRFEMIHSLDSLKLAGILSQKSRDREFRTSLLLEVNCSGDSDKSGVLPGDAEEFALSLQDYPGILLRGLMTIGPLGGGERGAREAFRLLREIRDRIRARNAPGLLLEELSMGMSEDFEIAIEEGASMVRVGRSLFETRE
ncbi:MAG: YggS family pyridoxal phosphate-dependent enzyme, partial [Candidatus Krumholzibacteria bacterium]|nr:YggS family pyridoxal phosphate-dependent enzyme [Candidatus Krumholzibacteria bacterium]